MNLGETYEYVNFVLNRDQLGDPASPEKFNLLLNRFNILHYNSEYQLLIQLAAEKGLPLAEIIYEAGAMKRFEESYRITYTDLIPFYTSKPDNYKRALTLSIFSENSWRPVEIMAPKSFDNATKNVMRNPIEEFPIAREYNTKFLIYPTPSQIKLEYIRVVLDPYFDYCLDQGDNVIYMPVGSILINGGQEAPYNYALLDSNEDIILDGVALSRTYTHKPYTSDSVELDWDDEYKTKITEDVIGACSTRAREFEMVQKATIDKQQL